MAKFLLPALVVLTALSSASDNSQPLTLVQHGADVSNIRSIDVGPFRLHAQIRVLGEGPLEADYLLFWVSPERWREEITIGTEHAIRIGGHGTVSSKDNSEQAHSVRMSLLSLDASALLNIRPGESLSGVKSREHHGVTIQCVSQTAKLSSKAELCFDPVTGVLVRRELAEPTGGHRTSEFSKYSEFNGKLFPRLVRTFRDKELDQQVEVQELAHDPDPAGGLFEADTQYKTMPGCEHPVGPRAAIKLPHPEYPAMLRTRGKQIVKLSATIDESGGMQDIAVIRSAGALDPYAIKALRKWKFTPATCGGVAVPFQFYIEVNFRTY
jgi:TonB family protein